VTIIKDEINLKTSLLQIENMMLSIIIFIVPIVLSVPTPTPQPASFELRQHHNAVKKLNLTQQRFNEIASQFSHVLSDPVNKFSKQMLRTLTSKEEYNDKNIIVSPFSIHTALSMLFYGSPKNSSTNDELAQLLNLSTDEGSENQNYLFNYLYLLKFYNDARRIYNAEVEIANKIFLQNGFDIKEHFKTLLEAFYLTSTQTTDFAKSEEAADTINEYVEKKTRGLIDEIISPQDVGILTRLVLVNAIYFKANWKYQFNKQFTSPMFYNLLGNQGRVQHERGMKVLAAFRSGNSEKLNSRILELPYDSDDFNMYILIPKNNTLESLNDLTENYDIDEIEKSLKSSPNGQLLKVFMPAFETTFKTEMKDTLELMGVSTLFRTPNLGDISDEPLYVSDVLHKAQVKINEEGSEAAAATGVIVNTRSGGPSFQRQPEFRVDQPFVFIIHDNANKLPLFIGRIINPSGKTIEREREITTERTKFSLNQNIANESILDKLINAPVEANINSSEFENRNYTDCIEGKQHDTSSHKDSITFPCKGRDTDVVEKAENSKKEEESEKFRKLQELRNGRVARFH